MDKGIQNVFDQRITRTKKAINLEQPDQVPILGIIGSWAASYAGYSITEILYDYDKYNLAVRKMLQDFDFDCVRMGGGARPEPVFQAIGASKGGFVSSGADSALQYVDTSYMSPEQYPEFTRDPYAFIFNKVLPSKYPGLAQSAALNTIALTKAGILNAQYQSTNQKFMKDWVNDFGTVALTRGSGRIPFDVLADFLRGFREIMIDIKRRPEEVLAACEAILPLTIQMAKNAYGPPQRLPLILTTLHLATFLGPKAFERFYWPTFRAFVQAMTSAGYGLCLFFEGNWNSYIDYLADLPGEPGQIVAIFETVDMVRAKQVLGKKVCIAGNFPIELLFFGSKADIENTAKKMLDELAPGGGYILTTDKSWQSAGDAKPENMQILINCVKRYGVY